jgi:hypothetical protein
MYINKIDDLIDKVIDDFYINVILTEKSLIKLFKEVNFVKFQKEINEIINNFTKSIDLTEIKELVKSNDAVHTISETLKRYIAFYLFLTIGFNYTAKNDTYINNVVEFTKNQPEFGFKIDNFFNSESNALLIKYHIMISNIVTLLTSNKEKMEILKIKLDFKEAIIFLNQLGGDFIKKNFIESSENTKQNQGHNLIKTIIVLLLYKVTEKKEFFRLLEMTENLDGEYMFIDIVVPKKKYIDFNSVEQLIGSSATVKNLAYYLWDFVTECNDAIQRPPISIDEKVVLLIKSGIFVPICDDFLLFHKDSERYDKAIDPNKIKKKEDTKIRYVINKIDTTSEFYSEQVKKDEKTKNNVKKNFYIPLLNRKAITVNHNEDVSIINKFINQGKRSVENNEYFNDLVNYKTYPYINFKDFDKNGFSITFPSTLDVVRCISFAKDGEFKQNSYNALQLRVGSKDTIVNIVGFMIPTNLKPLQCLKTGDVIDLKLLDDKNKNGFDLTIKYLKKSLLGTEKHSSSVFWLFDLDTDNVVEGSNEYEQATKYTTSDQIKKIVSTLYDTLINEMHFMVVSKLEKEENLSLQHAYRILNSFENKLLKVPKNSDVLTKLENTIYSLVKKIVPEYDKKDDIVYGISSDVIKLIERPNPPESNIQLVKIDLSGLNEYGVMLNKETVEGICQHNISWDRIASIQKSNPKLYTDELYRFIQQYVTENVEQEFVCKSCSHQLNMKKYIIDGVFDDDTQKFITYSMPMEVSLEDIPEYEKFKVSIRNIDKLIEKLASISNIPHLMKSSSSIKWRRKSVVKDLIDILLLNNAKLKPILKERNEKSTKTYGISRDLSNLFVFELENSIFAFTSKERDYYRAIKQNNVLAYISFLLLLEINDSQIPFMGTDKKGLCNFTMFDKIFYSLFGGLKIIINSRGELENITNYKILCYLIYIIGCPAIKYNMWYFESTDPAKKKKLETIIHIQKIFVHTVVDIMNSILEFSSEPNANYLYEILSVKTFKKIQSTFKNDDLYKSLQKDLKSSIVGEKKDFILTKSNFIPLSGKFEPILFDKPIRTVCKLPRMFLNKKEYPIEKYYYVNNITNCVKGQFHEWGPKDGHFVCKNCNVTASDLKLSEKESQEISNNFKFVRLRNLSIKFCPVDGLSHQFTPSNDKHICIKCKNDDKHEYSDKELLKLEEGLDSEKKRQAQELEEKVNDITVETKKEVAYSDKVVEYIKKGYTESKSKGYLQFINGLIDELQIVLGNEINIGDNGFAYLKENSYIINHDHLGYPLEKNVILTDDSNKIFYTQNHPFFKTDVIHYTSYKNGKINIFYNATTRILLGYKEESKQFVLDKKQNNRLIVNYSILNKLRMLGHQSQFIELEHRITELKNSKITDKNVVIKTVISDLIRERVNNLKKVIYEFQRTFFRILNNFSEQQTDENSEYFSNKLNLFIEKQKKNLVNINIFDAKGNHMVFKHWKGITRGIYGDEVTELKHDFDKQKTISCEDINKLDENGNMILYFIVTEFIKLLKYNLSKFSKLSTCEFIVEFINNVFELFNNEKYITNLDVKRFSYILSSITYIQAVSEKTGFKEVEGIYDEHQDFDQEVTAEQKEENIDLEEEQEALDMEDEYQFESGFDQAQDWEPKGEIMYSYE